MMKYLALITLPAAALLGACGSDSPAEERTDTVEQVTEQRADALEERGDAIEDAYEQQAEAVEDLGNAQAEAITGETNTAIPQ